MKMSLVVLTALTALSGLMNQTVTAGCPLSGGSGYYSYPTARSYHGTRFHSYYYSHGFGSYSYRPAVSHYRVPSSSACSVSACSVQPSCSAHQPTTCHSGGSAGSYEPMPSAAGTRTLAAPPVEESGPPRATAPPTPPTDAPPAPQTAPADDAPPLTTQS